MTKQQGWDIHDPNPNSQNQQANKNKIDKDKEAKTARKAQNSS